jgi:hypothetical protein
VGAATVDHTVAIALQAAGHGIAYAVYLPAKPISSHTVTISRRSPHPNANGDDNNNETNSPTRKGPTSLRK